ncbi:MAG: YqzL family protein [Clostridia bacterium]|nr:YqzL family protein [Clostridia bacterium]
MLENLSWELFCKTGNIDDYLLYKQSINVKENSGDYGTDKNDGSCHQTDAGKGQ